MYVARILYPVKVLGPGRRIGIWFCGCRRRCQGCSNPELWDFQKKYMTTVDVVVDLVRKIAHDNPIDGFTITGGDPFEQPEELADLLPFLREISPDILIYTGYKLPELECRFPSIISLISVIVDGEYVEELNKGSILRGSDNQVVHVINTDYKKIYDCYLNNSCNEIQNFISSEGIISVGIHRTGFEQNFNEVLSTKGLEIKNE